MQPINLLHSTLVSVILFRFVKCGGKAPCCVEENGWSPWGSWSECSKTCGKGDQIQSRTCHQAPGVACPGYAVLTRPCYSQTCSPVNGKWSLWEDWGDCTKTCGGGVQQRKRTCNSPPPSSGGSECTGKEVETQICNSNGCPVDGGWGPWSDWSGCSSSCGNGQRFRVRSCNNLPTANGGAPCRGRRLEILSCNNGDCQTKDTTR